MRFAASLLVLLAACGTTNSAGKRAVDADAGDDASDAGVTEDAEDADAAPARVDMTDASIDGGISGWCAASGLHFFCDDFDEDALAHNWDDSVAQHGALSLDGANATSPPFALRVQTTALSTGDVARVALGKSIVDAAPHLHFAFDFACDAPVDPAANAVVFSVQLLDGSGAVTETLSLRVSSTMASLDDSAPGALDGGADFTASHAFAVPALAAPSTWSRLAVDVDFGDDGGVGMPVVSISVDAKVVVARAAMAPNAEASQPEIQLGVVSATGPSSAVAVRFDDFTFATIP